MPFKFNPFTGTLDEVNLSTGAQGPAGPSGATGPSGPPGTPGVVSGTVPITYDSGTQTIGITAATTTVAGSMSANDKTKLDGIASGATANSSDAFLLSRTNHTGTQSGATVTGFYTAAGLTMNTARILGRTTASSGAAEEITIGSGLVLSGGTLVATATGSGGTGTPGGSTTQVQFNDSGSFAGDADLTWDKTANVLAISGDVSLSDGGTFTTTLQTITPTAARTISLPDATGTVALVAGSSAQTLYNLSGTVAGASTTFNTTTGTRFVVPFGYGAGAGGTVTQATNKSTGVTLNTSCGQVTMNGANLVTATAVSFTLTNSQIAATDVLILNNVSGGSLGAYMFGARCAAGSATITVRNLTAGDLAEALVIGFAVIKASTT